MLRLSRNSGRLTWAVALAAPLFVLQYGFGVYLMVLNHRIGTELVGRQWQNPTRILAADGREIASVWGADWRLTPPVKLQQLPPYVANAFLAAEDVRFRHHVGVDPIGVLRAVATNLRARGISQGGSTIDQQLIKTKFLSSERTWRRKGVEATLAILLDARMPKDDILEAYLNLVYLGHSGGKPVLGIEEGARLYFDQKPQDLTPAEAALLAGIIRAPNRDTPDKHPDAARARRDAILAVMREHHWLADEAYRRALLEPVEFHGGTIRQLPYPFYMTALHRELVARVGNDTLVRGGLTVASEMNPRMQQQAERAVRSGVSALSSRYSWIAAAARTQPLEAALLAVDPATGGIRALVGGSDYRRSPFDRATAMRRQPGSAFKPFAYVAAIATRRVTTATLLHDSPLRVELANNTVWEPQNYDEKFRGRVTVRQAFEKSLNVPTVALTQEIGLDRVIRTASRFGFDEEFDHVPALPLGVTEVTMRELTAAYTVFPNLGRRSEPYLLRSVTDHSGSTLFAVDAATSKVIDPPIAYVMHSLLRGVVQRGTASRLGRYGLGWVAGKTGTTSDYRDAWFVGYTPEVVASVWVGFDQGEPLRLSSAEAAIPIWGAFMASASRRPEIRPPAGVTFRDIDPETGMLWQSDCPGPVHEVFLDGTAPTHHCPRGLIGGIVRRVFFGSDSFDEPAAITAEKVRRWAIDVDQGRQTVQRGVGRLERWWRSITR